MYFYSFVRKSDLDSIMDYGLGSSIAISHSPKILSHIFKDDESKEIFIQSISPEDITQRGPSVFLQKPPPIKDILDMDEDHPLGDEEYVLIKIDFKSLSEDEEVKVFGLELEPYHSDEEYNTKKDRIEGDLTEESIDSLSNMSTEEAWSNFEPMSGYFAPNVPHAVVITDSGFIDPKYISLDERYMRSEAFYEIGILKESKRKLTSKPSSEKTLRDWFSRKGGKGGSSGWVDCNTCRKGKCKPCGRKKGEKRSKYPACRPTPASCKKYRKSKGKSWGKKSKASLFPFEEKLISNKTSIRKFAYNVDKEDLVWHRDKEDRVVSVIKASNWFIQFENKLPLKMKNGDVIKIKKNSWHRVIKGNGDLIIKIKK